jgi:2-polyprenyl-3-methyl-5-hydroxy-6-metoxy-1,4-benzoquinol methylase
VELADPHLGKKMLGVGAGHGTFTERLTDFGEVVAVDPATSAAQRLCERFEHDDNVTALAGLVTDVDDHSFHTAVMINVLEHIEDDAEQRLK